MSVSPAPSGASSSAAHRREVEAGQRFPFGDNWRRFLAVLNEDRIAAAEEALAQMLGTADLSGKTFLDIGSGSGLSSLAARRMGAVVHSFDYDPESVECTRELRRRYFPDDPAWVVEQGSALDEQFMSQLRTFDIVYSWGVLHHTGDMWRALTLAQQRVSAGGLLFIAIYNDQGAWSHRWRQMKRLYCSGRIGRWFVSTAVITYWVVRNLMADLLWMRNPLHRYTGQRGRGMSRWHDWHDWLGGYPFEVAKPEELLTFYQARGFTLVRLRTVGGSMGCNEYVLSRPAWVHQHPVAPHC